MTSVPLLRPLVGLALIITGAVDAAQAAEADASAGSPWSWGIGLAVDSLPAPDPSTAGAALADDPGMAYGLEFELGRRFGSGQLRAALAFQSFAVGDADDGLAYAGEATRLRLNYVRPFGDRWEVVGGPMGMVGAGDPWQRIAGSDDYRIGERGSFVAYGAEAAVGFRLFSRLWAEARVGWLAYDGSGRLEGARVEWEGDGAVVGLALHYRGAFPW